MPGLYQVVRCSHYHDRQPGVQKPPTARQRAGTKPRHRRARSAAAGFTKPARLLAPLVYREISRPFVRPNNIAKLP